MNIAKQDVLEQYQDRRASSDHQELNTGSASPYGMHPQILYLFLPASSTHYSRFDLYLLAIFF
jgi:hypothetical protein